jgi:hypothetical protein
MSIFDLDKEVADLSARLTFLDADDADDAEEIKEIYLSLEVLASQAKNIADWYAKRIHESDMEEKKLYDLEKQFNKRKKSAQAKKDFFTTSAIDFMIKHNLKESNGELFKISRSLTPGSVVIDSNLNVNTLPKGYYDIVPAVAEHRVANKKALQEMLRDQIKKDGKLDQSTNVVRIDGLAGVSLVRTQSLRIK